MYKVYNVWYSRYTAVHLKIKRQKGFWIAHPSLITWWCLQIVASFKIHQNSLYTVYIYAVYMLYIAHWIVPLCQRFALMMLWSLRTVHCARVAASDFRRRCCLSLTLLIQLLPDDTHLNQTGLNPTLLWVGNPISGAQKAADHWVWSFTSFLISTTAARPIKAGMFFTQPNNVWPWPKPYFTNW